MVSLKGKTVFITGSSLGIGKETAFKFAKEGAKVIITYFKDRKEAEVVEKKCKELEAVDTLVLPLNVMGDQSIKDTVKKVVDKFGVIDILINNAGVVHWNNFQKQTFEEIETEVRTNLEGLIKMTKEALPYIKNTIINISSGAGITGYGGLSVYCATKFGVRGFTQSLAQELDDIKVYSGQYNVPSGSDINLWEVT